MGKPLIVISRASAPRHDRIGIPPVLLRPSPEISIFSRRPSKSLSAIRPTPKSMALPIAVKPRTGSRAARSTFSANDSTLSGLCNRCHGIVYRASIVELHWKRVTATPP